MVDRHRSREREYAALARRVGSDLRLSCQSLHRGHVDNRSAASAAHQRDGVLGSEKLTFEIYTQNLIPCFFRSVHSGSVALNAGGTNEDIDPAIQASGEGRQSLKIGRRADIGSPCADLQPRLAQLGLLLSEAFAHVADDHRSSPGRQPLDSRQADARRSPCDYCDSTFEFPLSHHKPPTRGETLARHGVPSSGLYRWPPPPRDRWSDSWRKALVRPHTGRHTKDVFA